MSVAPTPRQNYLRTCKALGDWGERFADFQGRDLLAGTRVVTFDAEGRPTLDGKPINIEGVTNVRRGQ